MDFDLSTVPTCKLVKELRKREGVFTKDVEPWTVVGGNPAKFIKKRELKDD